MSGGGEEREGEAKTRLEVELPLEVYEALEELAVGLGSDPQTVASRLLDVIASYKGIILELAGKLRVRKEHKVDSVFEELVYYGVEAWRGVLEPILRELRAVGRFELETLELDPETPSLEVELVALEGSDLLADVVRLNWSPDKVIMEVLYYLDEDAPPPIGLKVEKGDWAYLPDEHAILVTFQARKLSELPPIHVVDRIVEPFL